MQLGQSLTLRIALTRNYWFVVMIGLATSEAVLLVLKPRFTQQIIDAIIQQRAMQWALGGFAVVAILAPLCAWASKIVRAQGACRTPTSRFHPRTEF